MNSSCVIVSMTYKRLSGNFQLFITIYFEDTFQVWKLWVDLGYELVYAGEKYANVNP